MEQHFYSHGKLLLTGEYVVLDGALSLAIPSKYGQHMKVSLREDSKLSWKSYNNIGKLWFKAEFSITDDKISCIETNNIDAANRLIQIFLAVNKLEPNFFKDSNGFEVVTTLEFPNEWGLGTSSTLINNIALWTEVDPYYLLEHSFGGSGYDIACAKANGPITYRINKESAQSPNAKREVKTIDFNPSFKDQLFFVHLNKKQDSREGISNYKSQKKDTKQVIKKIDTITEDILICETLKDFQGLIESHEQIIGSVTNQLPVKQDLFPDFSGSIKSLGAWGGDFILVASEDDPRTYFNDKGYSTVIDYKSMIL